MKLDVAGIRNRGAKRLAEALTANNVLTHLSLKSSKIHDKGAIALAEMLKTNTALTWLELRDNKFTEKGVLAFINALMVKNTTMEYLGVEMKKMVEWEDFQSPIVGITRDVIYSTSSDSYGTGYDLDGYDDVPGTDVGSLYVTWR